MYENIITADRILICNKNIFTTIKASLQTFVNRCHSRILKISERCAVALGALWSVWSSRSFDKKDESHSPQKQWHLVSSSRHHLATAQDAGTKPDTLEGSYECAMCLNSISAPSNNKIPLSVCYGGHFKLKTRDAVNIFINRVFERDKHFRKSQNSL